MVDIYYKLIIARPQYKTFAQVKEILKPAVHAMLLANGYDDNGDKIPVLITPLAPNVTLDDTRNIILGIDSTMEYAVDSLVNYIVFDIMNPPNLPGIHYVNIRVSAVAGVSNASLPTVLYFTTDAVTPDAPNVTADDQTNTIVGINNTMEYSIDGGLYIGYNISNVIDLSGEKIVKVRVKAEGINPVSSNTTLVFTTNI